MGELLSFKSSELVVILSGCDLEKNGPIRSRQPSFEESDLEIDEEIEKEIEDEFGKR